MVSVLPFPPTAPHGYGWSLRNSTVVPVRPVRAARPGQAQCRQELPQPRPEILATVTEVKMGESECTGETRHHCNPQFCVPCGRDKSRFLAWATWWSVSPPPRQGTQGGKGQVARGANSGAHKNLTAQWNKSEETGVWRMYPVCLAMWTTWRHGDRQDQEPCPAISSACSARPSREDPYQKKRKCTANTMCFQDLIELILWGSSKMCPRETRTCRGSGCCNTRWGKIRKICLMSKWPYFKLQVNKLQTSFLRLFRA